MNAGIDMDGVLVELNEYIIKKAELFFNIIKPFYATRYKLEILKKELKNNSFFKALKKSMDSKFEYNIDETAYDVDKMYDCSRKIRMVFWTIFIWEYSLFRKPQKGAKEFVDFLRDCNINPYLISSKAYAVPEYDKEPTKYEKMRKEFLAKMFKGMAYHWMEKNKINIDKDKIVFCEEKNSAEDKVLACKERNIRLIFEDKVDNIWALEEAGIKVIVFRAKYNQEILDGKNIKVVDSWEEAYLAWKDFEKQMRQENKVNGIKNFKPISGRTMSQLNEEQIKDYYEKLKVHYSNLPIDKKWFDKAHKIYKNYGIIIENLIKKFYEPIIIGKNLIPNDESVIFCSNHISSLDQFLLGTAVGRERPIHFVAKDTLLKLKRGKLYKAIGTLFVNPKDIKSGLKVLDDCSKTLSHGYDIGIYTEGTRNFGYKFMGKHEKSAVMLSQKNGTKIIPVAVTDDWGFGKRRLIIRFGDPIKVLPGEKLEDSNQQMEDIISTMIWENTLISRPLTDKEKNRKERKIEKIKEQRKKIDHKEFEYEKEYTEEEKLERYIEKLCDSNKNDRWSIERIKEFENVKEELVRFRDEVESVDVVTDSYGHKIKLLNKK